MQKNKELKMGDIVAKIKRTTVERFMSIARRRQEAYNLLESCRVENDQLWKDVIAEKKLDSEHIYTVVFSTGEIVVGGNFPSYIGESKGGKIK